MAHMDMNKTPFAWMFVDEAAAGIPFLAVVGASVDTSVPMNVAIKFQQGVNHFGVTVFKGDWHFAEGKSLPVVIDFGDHNPKTLNAAGNGQFLDIMLPIESAAPFLSLVATSKTMGFAFQNNEVAPWAADLMFAEPFVRKALIRLIQDAAHIENRKDQ